jgi:iron complex transport system permease protein
MGFDALYVLLQTGLALALGPLGFATMDPWVKFAAELALLCAAAVLVFGALLGKGRRDLHRMVLAGIVCGVLFHSLAAFGQRLMDPGAFSVVQGASFAQFNRVNGDLLPVAGALAALCIGAAWRMRHQLDVLALGRDLSVNLGLDHGRVLRRALLLVGALVAISTARVGPVAFFGLLVTSLAHLVMRSHRHALLLPAAALIAAIALVGGQTLFERVLGHAGTLSVAVEFLGGLLFLFLVLRRPAQ